MKQVKSSQIPVNILMYLGITALAFGIISIVFSDLAFKIGIITVGSIIGLTGLSMVILSAVNKDLTKATKIFSYIGSGILIIGGILLIVYSSDLLEILIIILGIFVCLGGIAQLVLSLSYKYITYPAKIFVGFALVMIISGTIIALNPFKDTSATTLFFGIIVSIFGASSIVMSFWIRSKIKKTKSNQPVTIEVIPENN